MKTRTLCAAALCALVLVGCGKKGADKFNDVKLGDKATAGDTISYYIGEQMASQRVQMAATDTLLKSAEAQARFDEGFYAGLDAMTGDDKAFNRGFIMGAQVASELMAQGEAMDEEFSIDALASGYKNSFDKNGKAAKELDKKAMEHQGVLMANMQRLQAKAMKKQSEDALKKTAAAKKGLDAAAKKQGYKQVNGIYVKEVKAGNGTKLKAGDQITATLGLSDSKGNAIFPPNSVGQTVGTGDAYSPAIDAVQTALEMGGQYMIIGTVDQILASDMAAQAIMSGQLDPTQLYIIDYSVAPAAEIAPAAVAVQ